MRDIQGQGCDPFLKQMLTICLIQYIYPLIDTAKTINHVEMKHAVISQFWWLAQNACEMCCRLAAVIVGVVGAVVMFSMTRRINVLHGQIVVVLC